jgi:protein-S-isoprenylcysteine O-methyltransferase
MNIGNLLFVVGVIWASSEVLLVFFRRSNANSTSRDSGSVIWLNAVIYGSIAVAVAVRSSGVGMIPGLELPLAWVGLAFILFGLAIRWVAILTLRQYFTVNVAILPDHRIVRTGLYRHIRHPSYSGSILSFVGLGLALGNWIALAFLSVSITSAFIWRIQIEERALVQEFGPQYEDYCRATRRLIPWIY